MKNIYSITISILLLLSASVFGQTRIYAPTLNEPENGELGLSPDALLNWYAVTGDTLVILYEAQLSSTEDFSDPVTFPLTDLTSYSMSNLYFGEQYFWRVRAYEGEEVSDWSEIWSFNVLNTIELDKPKSGALVYSNPIISWDEVTGMTKYQIQFDTAFTWQLSHTITTKSIFGSCVLPDGKKWIVGDMGLIMHYDGSNWISYDVSDTITFNDVFFINESSGYAVGDDKVIYYFNGTSWSLVEYELDKDGNYYGVSFADENTGWIVGNIDNKGFILKYADGEWSQDTTFPKGLYSIFTINDTNVWACGKSKTVVHFDGNEWSKENVGTRDYNDIWFVDENNGFVVGKSGKILYYNGTEWEEQESNTNNELFGVAFAGNVGYVVGDKGTLLNYNGGLWELNSSGVEYKLNTVSVLSEEEITLYGENGIILNPGGGEFDSPFVHIIDIDPDSTEHQFNQLYFGQPYYYRMRGIHSLDTSYWSMAKSIRTYAKPVLVTPENGSSDMHLLMEFIWDRYEGITNYILEVDSNENFTLPRTFGPDQNRQLVNDFVFEKEYFWRVKAQHFLDISDWSEVWNFTTVNTIILKSPENGATNVLQCPRYTWEKVVGASRYLLWVDTDESFSNPMQVYSDSAYFQCQSSLERKTIYYWKVRGQSGASISNWSEVWSFETEGYDGIEENIDNKVLQMYPNPNNGEFTIQINSLTNGVYEISVVDLVGKELYKLEMNCRVGDNIQKLNLQNLEKGIYLVHLRMGERTITKKLFVR